MQIRGIAAGPGLLLGRGGSVVLLALVMAGCLTVRHTGTRGLPEKRGTASYYADKFIGRTTASGDIYDPDALTAAHRSLPFGTRVRVTRTDHADTPSVVVRINDRGPFKYGRIIDVSKAAARELEMIREGIVEVRLKVVSYPSKTASSSSSDTEAGAVGW